MGNRNPWAEQKGQQTKDGTTLELTIFALTVKKNKACRQANRTITKSVVYKNKTHLIPRLHAIALTSLGKMIDRWNRVG